MTRPSRPVPAQRLEVRKIVVTVANKNINFGNILHFATGRFNHGLEVTQYLFVLSHEITIENIAFGVTAGLAGQEEELSARDEDAMAEAAGTYQLWWVDDSFLHDYLPLSFKAKRLLVASP